MERQRTIVHSETTVEVKLDAKVIVELKDSDYHSEVESCNFRAWSDNGKLFCSIETEFKIFDETERNAAILRLSDDEIAFKLDNSARRLYASWCDKISIEDIITKSESEKSRLYEVIDGLIVDLIVESI